jgi:hypothetical protein
MIFRYKKKFNHNTSLSFFFILLSFKKKKKKKIAMSVATTCSKISPQNQYIIEHFPSSILSDRLGYASTCLQQQNNTPQQTLHVIEGNLTPVSVKEEQFDKKKLIQAATNRLRQKNIEREYEAFKSRLVELQSQLEVIKLDTTISFNLLPKDFDENQLSFFEKRLNKHKTQLQQVLTLSNTETTTTKKNETGTKLSRKMISLSLSSFSKSSFSNISSLLSFDKSRKTEEESDYYSILGGSILNHQKRRKRRHQQSQKVEDPQEPSEAKSTSSLYYTENQVQPSSIFMESSDIGTRELLVLHSIQQEQTKKDELIKRNALDDTLSFINELKSDTDDGGFKQDVYNMISDMITKAQLENKTIDQGQYYYAAEYPISVTPPLPDTFAYCKSNHYVNQSLLEKCISTGWRWVRFAIVMTLAIMINLKKGPISFLNHQHAYNHFTSYY